MADDTRKAGMTSEERKNIQRMREESDWMNIPNTHREIMSSDDWGREFDSIRRGMARIHAVMDRLEMSHTPTYARLRDEVRFTEEAIERLSWYFCKSAIEKWSKGQRLSKEDVYLFAAQGLLILPSSNGMEEAFEEYDHYYYEDDERKGYISDQSPDPLPAQASNGVLSQRVRLKMGIMAEDVRTSFLRADQMAYFTKHQPELFSRFKKN